jgi:hypothetical protein
MSDLDAGRPLSFHGQPRDHCLCEDGKIGPVHVREGIRAKYRESPSITDSPFDQ